LEYAYRVSISGPQGDNAIKPEPRNLQEAMDQAEAARNNYRTFFAANPAATPAQRAEQENLISAADAAVTRFSSQQTIIAQTTPNTSYAEIDRVQQLAEADSQRRIAADYARNLRYGFINPPEIAAADQRAIAAELYYQSLVSQQSQLNTAVGAGTTQSVLQPQISNTYVGAPTTVTQPQTPDPLTTGSVASTTSSASGNNGVNLGQISNSEASQLSNQLTSLGTTLINVANGSATDTTFNPTSSGSSSAGSADRRIKIAYKKGSYSGILAPLGNTDGMIFPFTPVINYKGSTNYNVLATPHANQDWHIYQNTASVQISISGIFTAQNPDEAKYMLAALQFLRSVSKMHFGENDANKGLPPPQCILTGYGDYMFNRLSVIVNDFNMELPNNVDYVEVNSGEGVSDVPSITTINVSLTVQNTPKKNREFNWDEFASGALVKKGGWI
jgi:hypothetical protein